MFLEKNASQDMENPEPLEEAPWKVRIDKIRERSPANLENILSYWSDPNKSRIYQIVDAVKKPENQKEIEHIKETLKVTINTNLEAFLAISRDEKIRTLAELPDRCNVFKYRKESEARLNIQPEGNEKDPELVYGALTHNTRLDDQCGGAPIYGDTIFILKTENIENRTTFTLGDSSGVKGPNEIVTWDYVAPLKFIRDHFPRLQDMYVEAQIAGGVRLDDIEEIKIKIYSTERREEIENDPDFNSFKTKHPEIRISFIEIKNNSQNTKL